MKFSLQRAPLALVGLFAGIAAHAQVLRVDIVSPANESSIAFSPGGSQARALPIIQAAGGISSVTVGSGGAGYTVAPTVTVQGTGTGAAVTAVIDNLQGSPTFGQVTALNVTNPGSGYVGTPTVTIGSGGTAKATVGAVTLTPGEVVGFNLSSTGSGYTTAPQVTITGGGGSGASAVATVSNGLVTGLTLTSPGAGYVTAPTVSIAPPPGVVAISARVSGTDTLYTTQIFVNGAPVSLAMSHTAAFDASASWTPPQPGSYFITAKTVDSVGNTATSLPIRIFITGATVLSPVPNTLVPLGSSVVISGDATFAQGFIRDVEFLVNGTSIGIDTTAPYSLPYTPPTTGAYQLTVRARDNNNNVATSAPVTIQTVNPIGSVPTTRIVNPVNNSSVAAGRAVNILTDATDSDGIITKVELYLNGVLLTTDTSFPFTGTWTPAVPGRYYLVALAFDDKGNVAASSPTMIDVTGGFPTVQLTSPATAGMNVIQGTKVAVAVSAAGSDGGITSLKSLELLVDGNVNDSLPKNPLGLEEPPPLTPPFVFTWQSNVALGTHRLAARVTDVNGLTITSPEIPVTVIANQPPQISISNPAAGASYGANTPVTIAANASDVDGSVERVEFFANGVSIGSATASPYQVTWSPSAAGPYDLTAKVTDNAGASVTSGSVSVTVDPPAASGATTSNVVYRGTYGNSTESGRFALGVNRVGRGTFIAYSTAPAGQTYFWTDFPVNTDGTFSVRDSSNAVVLSGQTSATGVSGTFGNRTFIGPITMGSGTFSPLLLSGNVSGAANTPVVAIVGGDGSITVYSAAGSQREAGSDFITSSGAYQITTPTGGRITGAVTPTTNVVSGALSGNVTGAFLLQQRPGRLSNISTRTLAGTGDRTLVAGFVIRGTGTKPLLVRAVGPSLANFGVTTPLADPSVTILSPAATVGSNDNWGNSAALAALGAQLGAFPLNVGSRDAALQVSAAPGLYTAVVDGAGAAGTALIEIYDAQGGTGTAQIANISTRGQVSAGDALIAGFVITGDQRKQLLIRAVGPTLAGFGISSPLSDPKIEVLAGTSVVATNDNWSQSAVSTASAAAGAFPLAPNSRDAALVTQLSPGAYTVQVTGVDGATGPVLIEIYDLDR